ncbi:hypothetical protein ACJMK2_022613, partial [Sinanodonta woodiana]
LVFLEIIGMKSNLLWATLVALFGAVLVSGMVEEIPMPSEMQSCLKVFQNNTSVADTVGEGLYFTCLNRFISRQKANDPDDCDLSEDDWAYFDKLIMQSLKYVDGVPVPLSGFRIRKEYRQLSNQARNAFHKAVIELKNVSNNYKMYEEALRRIDPTVSLPYWDYSIDYKMPDPTKSVVWTPDFLGNGQGVVNTGPFANWTTASRQLERNIGVDGRLISEEVINDILTKCQAEDVIAPSTANNSKFVIEIHHNNIHLWVGGDMYYLETAAFDPVFFVHHANIDYIWQLFRDHQRQVSSVDPAKNYPIKGGELHAPDRPMDRFPMFRNIDGFASYWEKYWYKYDKPATCSVVPDCGSPWLECKGGVCISKTAEERHLPFTKADTTKTRAELGSISMEIRDYNPGTGLTTPIQNNFFINGKADMKLWAFVPIKVIYMKPTDERFPIYRVYNGTPDLSQGFYNYPEHIIHKQPKAYSNCKMNPSGAGQIILESNGINYYGRYTEYAIIDSRLQIGSSMAYIGVKNPETEITEAIISAHDRCGRMCQPKCLDHGSNTAKYRPCSGAIRISPASPKMYGNTLGEAILGVWHWWDRQFTNTFELVMVCNNDAEWPWK